MKYLIYLASIFSILHLGFLTSIQAQDQISNNPLSMKEFSELEESRKLKAAYLAYLIQKRALTKLRASYDQKMDRGDFLAEVERQEFLLGELNHYREIRREDFKKVYDQKGSHLNFMELWEFILKPIMSKDQ